MTRAHEQPDAQAEPRVAGGLATEAASSIAWAMSQQWLARIAGFVTLAILARVLAPEDFGLVTVALSVLPLVQLLADLGFSTYLVQASKPSRRTYSTAFWYSSIAGLVLTGVLVLVAPLAAHALRIPEGALAIRSLAPAALIVSLSAVPLAILRRELRFRAIAIQSVVAAFTGQVVALILAFGGFGFWALVWQTLVYQAVVLAMAVIATRWRPVLEFSWGEFTRMFRFGVNVIGADFIAHARVWLENAIVVLFLGVAGLGYLTIAQRLVFIAQELTTNAVAPVTTVLFARIRDTAERLLAGYLRAQAFAYAIVVPILVVLAVGAQWVFPLVFGDQWEASIAPGSVLAVVGILTMSTIEKSLLLGTGRPGTWLLWTLAVEGMAVLAVLICARHGLIAIAFGFLGVGLVAVVGRWAIVARVLGTRWTKVAAPLLRVAPPALVGAAVGWLVSLVAPAQPIAALVAIGLGVLTGYLPVARLTMPQVWDDLRSAIRNRFGGVVRRGRRV